MPATSDIDIWVIEMARHRETLGMLDRHAPIVSAGTRDCAARLTDGPRRQDYIASHIALTLILRAELGNARRLNGSAGARAPDPVRDIAIEYDDFGKPHLEGCGLQFSLSRSEGLAAVAVSWEGSVGIDIERKRELIASARQRRRFYRRAAPLLGIDPTNTDCDTYFLTQWVRFEAACKLRGHGIAAEFARLGRGSIREEDAHFPPVIEQFDAPIGYLGALAHCRPFHCKFADFSALLAANSSAAVR